MKTIAQLQDEIEAWTDYNFPGEKVEDTTLGVAEEVGELCRAVLKRSQGIRGTAEEWTEEARKETADVFIKLCHFASKDGFDLYEAIQERWEEVRKRDFRADKIGHGLPEA